MSDYEVSVIIIGTITIVIALINLMIHIADKFSKRK